MISQCIGVGAKRETPIESSNHLNQTISIIVGDMALYSTLVEDLDITVCFFLFQEIRDSPKNMQNLVVDLLLVGSLAQFASE